MIRLLLMLCCILLPVSARGGILERDDQGLVVSLEKPARRIVSLAPSITELLYAAGAGERLVGVVDYSDFPASALKIARVGGAGALDIEKIASLRPDLVVAWKSGNSPGQIAQLEKLGIPIYYAEPRHLSDIPLDIERLGILAGSAESAALSAASFRKQMERLRSRYSGKKPVSVFYEIWPAPLMTVNHEHIISDVMLLCGARNVFGKLPVLTPTLDFESVLQADPEAIIASGEGSKPPPWLLDWKKWNIAASRKDNLFFVPADLISRPGPRILQGAQLFCSQVDEARNK